MRAEPRAAGAAPRIRGPSPRPAPEALRGLADRSSGESPPLKQTSDGYRHCHPDALVKRVLPSSPAVGADRRAGDRPHPGVRGEPSRAGAPFDLARPSGARRRARAAGALHAQSPDRSTAACRRSSAVPRSRAPVVVNSGRRGATRAARSSRSSSSSRRRAEGRGAASARRCSPRADARGPARPRRAADRAARARLADHASSSTHGARASSTSAARPFVRGRHRARS